MSAVGPSSGCPGEALTALVDGALAHDDRDRVHSHLAGCASCREEVEAQRALKGRLAALAGTTPGPPPELLQRLHGLAVPGVEPASGRPPPLPVGRATAGPRVRHPRQGRPPGRRAAAPPAGRGRRPRRSRAVGGGLLLVGVALALALGGPVPSAPSTPVDPGSDAFVVDFVSTTGEVPLADPAGRAALLPRP